MRQTVDQLFTSSILHIANMKGCWGRKFRELIYWIFLRIFIYDKARNNEEVKKAINM